MDIIMEKVHDLENEMMEVKEQLAVSTAEVSTFKGKLSTCMGELTSCKGEITNCKEELTSCKEELSTCKGEITNYKEELSSFKEELSICKGEIKNYKEELSSCKEELSTCKGEITNYKEELSSCKEELSTCKGEITNCKEELSSCKKELSTCKRENMNYKEELSHCKAELSSCKGDLPSCKDQLITCHLKLKDSRTKFGQLEKTVIENRLRINELEKSQSSRSVDPGSGVSTNQRVKAIERRLDTCEEELSRTRNEGRRLTQLQKLFNSSILKSHSESIVKQANVCGGNQQPDTRYQQSQTQATGGQRGAAVAFDDVHDGLDTLALKDVFCVDLSQEGPRTKWKFDSVKWIYDPSTPFIRELRRFRASYSGVYAFYVEFKQTSDDGSVSVWMLKSPHFIVIEATIGTTTSDSCEASKFTVLTLEKGDELMLKVNPQGGNARVWHCRFSGFLLSG